MFVFSIVAGILLMLAAVTVIAIWSAPVREELDPETLSQTVHCKAARSAERPKVDADIAA
jgi:hypothetical protein